MGIFWEIKDDTCYISAERGLASIWWDNGNNLVSNDGLALFNRQTLSRPFGEIADIIVQANN